MFDPSLKKRKPKKKTVVFNEEPEGPSVPAAAPAAEPGPSILKSPVVPQEEAAAPAAVEEKPKDDFGFGDLKKKKKKKEIPLDFGVRPWVTVTSFQRY